MSSYEKIIHVLSIHNIKKHLTSTSEVNPDTSSHTEGDGNTSNVPSDLKTLQEWEYKLKKVGKSLEHSSELGKLSSKTTLHYLSWVGNAEKLREHCVKTGSVNVNTTLNYDVTPLHLAAFKKNKEVIDVLMEHGAESDCIMEESDIQPLHIAASCGSVSCVRSILKSDARVDHTDKSGRTALHWAAARGYDNCVRELIRFQNGDPNVADNLRHKPICYALRSGYNLCIKELLKNESHISCSASCLGEDGWKLLHWLVEEKHVDCLEALLMRRDVMLNNIESMKDQDGVPLLIRALEANDVSILKLLLRNKGQLEYRDEFGNSLVHLASRENLARVMPTLLSTLDVNEKNKDGFAPLHLSALNGNLETLNVLLSRSDINVNVMYDKGNQYLKIAGLTPFLEVINTLVTKKEILENVSYTGYEETSFSLAVMCERTEVAKALVKHPNFLVNQSHAEFLETPLIIATIWHNVEVVKALLNHSNIEVNKTDEFDMTPLHWAAERGNVETVKILLARPDACINAKDFEDLTPLNLAATVGHIAIVNELLHNYRCIRKISLDEEDLRFDYNNKPIFYAGQDGFVKVDYPVYQRPGNKEMFCYFCNDIILLS